MLEAIKSFVLSETGISLIVTGLVALAGLVFKKFLTVERKKQLAFGVYHAYNIVNDIAKTDPRENGIDKGALGLEILNSVLLKQGWREATSEEKELAALLFKSMHGREATAEKLSELAAPLVATAPVSVPQ